MMAVSTSLWTNGMYREATNIDLLSRQMSAETPAARRRVMRDSPVMVESHLAYRNLGNLAFENVSADWGLNQKGVSFGSAFGDLDGDGNLDLVYSNYQKGITLLRNDCDTGHRVTVDLRGTVSNRFGVGATIRIGKCLGRPGAPTRPGARSSLEQRADPALRVGRRHAHPPSGCNVAQRLTQSFHQSGR